MVAGLFTTFLLPLSLHIITALAGSHVAGPLANRHHGLARRAEGNVQLYQRAINARFTFYNAQTGNAGSCGSMISNTDFTVAMNAAQMQPSWCYKSISISYNGQSTTAVIVDTCPGCPYLGLDLTPGLFQFLAPPSMGVIYGDWEFVGAPAPVPSPTPSSTPPPPASPTPTPTPPPSPSPSPSSPPSIQSPSAISLSVWTSSTSQSSTPTSKQSSVSTTSNHTSSAASSSLATPSVSINFLSGAASGLAEPTGTAVVTPETVNNIENLFEAIIDISALILVAQDG